MISLAETKEGTRVRIKKIDCGRNLISRLCAFGLREGSESRIIKNDSKSGPMIIQVFESKVAIGRGQAEKIMVEVLNGK